MSENKTSSSFAFARSLANVIGDEIGVGATVEATFAPVYEVGSDRGLKIEIAPVARRAVSTTRDGWSSALVAQIAIRKHIGTERDFERIDELIALDGGRYLGSANWRVAAFASRSFSGTDAPFPSRRESSGREATIVRPTAPSCRFKPTR